MIISASPINFKKKSDWEIVNGEWRLENGSRHSRGTHGFEEVSSAVPLHSSLKRCRLPSFHPMASGSKHQNNLLKRNSRSPPDPSGKKFDLQLNAVSTARL